MKKILTIGPTLLDISLQLKSENNFKNTKTNISIGGKGYNVAHNLSLFGIPSVLATMYGDDKIGKYLKKQIQKQGISLPDTNKIKKKSGIFVGVVDNDGETIFDKVDVGIFSSQQFPKVNWSDVCVVIVMSSTNNTILKKLIDIKTKNNKIIFCLEISGSKSVENIIPFLGLFDFFISNKKEAKAIGTCMRVSGSTNSIIKALIKKGITTAIITADKKGVICGINKGSKIILKEIPINTKKGKIISTIGAGDSVTASFCALHYYYKMPLTESLEYSMEIASLTVRSKLPFVKKIPAKIIKKINYEIL